MSKLKLGFDAKRAFHNHSGLGVYSRNLIDYIERTTKDIDIVLFSPTQNTTKFNTKLRVQSSKFGSLWRSFFIYFDIRKSNLDIYHGLAGELPFFIPNRTKTIVTIHDLLFLRFPQDYTWIDRTIYSLKARLACNKADKIIAVSQATKNDIVKYFSTSPDKIEVVSVGLNIDVSKLYHRLYPNEYLICISSFLPRKNQLLLIKAFELIAHKIDLDLLLIGLGSYWSEVKKYADNSRYKDRIIFIKNTTDDEKFAYLSHAQFSVYPSKYEGFGIPIIESMAYQIPILISDSEIHKEVADDAAIYFENENLINLSDKLVSTFNLTSHNRNELTQKGLKRVEKFKVKNVYPHLVEIYRDLVTD